MRVDQHAWRRTVEMLHGVSSRVCVHQKTQAVVNLCLLF